MTATATKTVRAWDLRKGMRVGKSEDGPGGTVVHVGSIVKDGHIPIFFLGQRKVWWVDEHREVEVVE